MKVGIYQKKEVSELNNMLYLKAREIMLNDENQGLAHIGFQGVSAFIDWLESNYDLHPKSNETTVSKKLDFEKFSNRCPWQKPTGLFTLQCGATGGPCVEEDCGSFSMIKTLVE